ncbi:MAG: 30S ribosomal protein S20 [Sporomusaceae bacterium]|nr:30S ribosomal protein S20 [Sporomusaceae bacterium]
MPNIKSSVRSVKSDAKRRARNFAVRSRLRNASRKVEDAIKTGDSTAAQTVLAQAVSVIDRAVSKGVIHKNAAARKKSRLAKKTNSLAQ